MLGREIEIYSPQENFEGRMSNLELLECWRPELRKFDELLITHGEQQDIITPIVRYSGIRMNESDNPLRQRETGEKELQVLRKEWERIRELGLIASSISFITGRSTNVDVDNIKIWPSKYANEKVPAYLFRFTHPTKGILNFPTKIVSTLLTKHFSTPQGQYFDDALIEAVMQRHP